MHFEPDYHYFVDAVCNRRPDRLPLYEHTVSPAIMEKVLGYAFAHEATEGNFDRFFEPYCRFFRENGYDVVSYEVGITAHLPGHGALAGGKPGPIQNRADFDAYPWNAFETAFWEAAEPRFTALARAMPPGMKAVGGIGNGLFEVSEDLVGLEHLPFMQVDDPELYADIYRRIGDLMCALWKRLLAQHGDLFAVCRIGDDLGFKSSLLTNPLTVHDHIVPQYRRVIELIHKAGKPFLWHSCGCIFEIMDTMIDAGIDAKHSNEDGIAPFSRWIEDYGDRIGLLGGFDMDFLCQKSPSEIATAVADLGAHYREQARGYALGSGNSIPEYVPVENYLAMVRTARDLA